MWAYLDKDGFPVGDLSRAYHHEDKQLANLTAATADGIMVRVKRSVDMKKVSKPEKKIKVSKSNQTWMKGGE
ncbi:hypothetical protein RU98_GL002196 [Enterococcus caccae]|nr:hypothetical protein RU98_GL002196 [Enterococcus caccae]